MKNEVIKTILKRVTVRKYQKRAIEDDVLNLILQAAISAPTARNLQRWHFTVITNQEVMQKMNQLAIEGMALVGDIKDDDYDLFHGAPLVIVITSPGDTFDKVNCGAALENIALAAESLNLASCMIGQTRFVFDGLRDKEIKALLKIPQDHVHDCSICLGYPLEKPEVKLRKDNLITYIK